MEPKEKKKRVIVIKQYTMHELAATVYLMSKYHLRKLLNRHKKEIGKREGNFYETEQVRTIFQLIPLPSDVELL